MCSRVPASGKGGDTRDTPRPSQGHGGSELRSTKLSQFWTPALAADPPVTGQLGHHNQFYGWIALSSDLFSICVS